MKMKVRKALGVVLIVCGLLMAKAYAGDLMNVEFLQKHAIRSDREIQQLTQALENYTAAKPPSKAILALNTVSNGLFTATYYITNVPLYRALGGIAGGMFYAPYPYEFFRSRKTYQNTQQVMEALSKKTSLVNAQVEALYYEWKQG